MSLEQHSKYTPWPAHGCSIYDASRRLVPEYLDAATEAQRTWEAAGGNRRRVISGGIGSDNTFFASRERQIRRLKNEWSIAKKEYLSRFANFLCEGKLVATGAKDSPTSSRAIISAHAWQYIRVVNAQQSIVEELTKTKTRWYGIAIHPALLAPNATELLTGVPFTEAFERYVLGDPEVRYLASRSAPTIGYADQLWPANLDLKDIAAIGRLADQRVDRQIVWAAMRHRYSVLISFCHSLGMQGTSRETGKIKNISPQMLRGEDARINVSTGELFRVSDGGTIMQFTSLRITSTTNGTVVLGRSGADVRNVSHVKPTTHDDVPPATRSHGNSRRSLSKQTPLQKRISDAVQALWPHREWTSLPVKERDSQIRDWQKANKWSPASEKTIQRYFRRVTRRR